MNSFINLTSRQVASTIETKKKGFKPNTLTLSLKKSLSSPPLFAQRDEDFETTDRSLEIIELTKSRAWKASISPGTSVVMYMFVFWMMGSNLNIFTIFFFFNALMTPIKSLLNLGTTFNALKNEHYSDFLFYKFIYVVINLGVLGFVLYKLYGIGLVPLNPSDYVEILPKNIQVPIVRLIYS